MLQYPSIPVANCPEARRYLGQPCMAFYKYDGSNLRWEWSPKQGWHKFGTRKQLFDKDTPLYSQAVPLFMEMADEVVRGAKKLAGGKVERITAFTEFFGESSFAGQHDEHEPKELALFDVFLYKRGFVTPQQFFDTFGLLKQAAAMVYKGPLTEEFLQDVNAGVYTIEEGLIIKGTREEFTLKAKTQAWYDRLKATHANWQELA